MRGSLASDGTRGGTWTRTDRSIDASFLTNESSSATCTSAAILIFEGPPPQLRGLPRARRSRLHLVPRFRQKLAFPPVETGRPFWVDDPNFNLAYHVRHSALPAPGSEEQLRNIAGPPLLAGARPLEAALGDLAGPGPGAQPLRADHQDPPRAGRRHLRRRHRHRPLRRQAGAGADRARPRLGAPSHAVLGGARGPRSGGRRRDPVQARAPSAPRPPPIRGIRRSGSPRPARASPRSPGTSTNPAPEVPLNVEIGSHRRFAWTRAELADFKRIKDALGGTVNDVVLTVVSGALRSWLRSRGVKLEGLELRALVPVSIRVRGRARPARQPDRRDARPAAGLHRGPGEAARGGASRRWTG